MIVRLPSRSVIFVLSLWCVNSLGACTPRAEVAPPAPQAQRRAVVPAVLGLTLTVSDLGRSERFFRALDFSLERRGRLAGAPLGELLGLVDPVVRVSELKLGDEAVELRQFESPSGRTIPVDAQSNDLSFQHMAIVVSDMDVAYQRLQRLGVHEVSRGPQTLPQSNPAAGGIRAFYFRDSDGHALELIQFPRGRGAARWQEPRRGVFLGVDHTAIVVADTDVSASLYAALGFGVSGHSLNFGEEQALLSGVPGARVRITGFAGRSGPGVEFLSYLAPASRGTRPSTRANDLGHWEITVRVAHVERALAQVLEQGGQRLSVRVVDVRELDLGYAKAVVVHDRDGHGLRLVEP